MFVLVGALLGLYLACSAILTDLCHEEKLIITT